MAADGLSELFGLEMALGEAEPVPDVAHGPSKPARARQPAKVVPGTEDVAPAAKTAKTRGSPSSPSTKQDT